ncbi:MAG: Tn3 family transposase [bacterium]|nr:Tn3 family transposase [bacterium]
MTRLAFLSPSEKRKFDSPPTFTKDQRPAYFIVTDEIRRTLSNLHTATHKIGFLLQLGYFRSAGKFYVPTQFRHKDIKYVKQLLNITADPDFDDYAPSRVIRHRKRILQLLEWQPFNRSSAALVAEHVQLLAQHQLKPEQVFIAAVDFCWKHRIEIPTYHQLSTVITDSFNIVESTLLTNLVSILQVTERTALDKLMTIPDDHWRPLLSEIKQVNQSLRAQDIQQNVDACQNLAGYFYPFLTILDALNLGDQATEYYAAWVRKAKLSQLKQFPNPIKRYLHLLAFIKHQYFVRQDVLLDIILKCVRTATNAAEKQLKSNDHKMRSERQKAVKMINKSHKNTRHILDEITRIVRSTHPSASEKIEKIERLLSEYETLQSEHKKLELQRYEKILDQHTDDQHYYDVLESQSLRLQRKVSSVLKAVVFDPASSIQPLYEAVVHFQMTDGHIGQSPPLDFLSQKERDIVAEGGTFRISLYKILLFQSVADAVRAGKLNLQFSYRYRAIQDYLIPTVRWQNERDHLLTLAGLESFADGAACLADLKSTLENTYQSVNKRYRDGENTFLTLNERGYVKVRTPATSFSEEGYIGSILTENGIVPVLQVLQEINRVSDFISCFKHLSAKHHKLKPSAETVLAGILGKGCNIGIDKLSHISIGINENTLKNTVNWCFSLQNIQVANRVVINLIDKLALSNAFRKYPGQLHTSSDGRKVNVAVDSLHASYSFKYFGKDKGVTLYTFIDERHALFHSTVISASDREAAYVIDGLMQNEVVKSDIHSTDTHGFSEAIFTATHMIDTAFAPRFKKIGSQKIYGFSSKSTYQKRGYHIVPSRTINQKLILKNWEDILRFMATIKLRYSSASQLFKRLSSYAKDHPLYQALKEFGRIIKTKFILTYYDDVELRQRIEKQLNKVELANKFSKAVFFASNQEFQEGTLEEQEIATACKVLIQNAIVLWNYLYLSQRLSDTSAPKEREDMIASITAGSIIAWRHVNLQGEYDFTRPAANDDLFDMQKILALKVG